MSVKTVAPQNTLPTQPSEAVPAVSTPSSNFWNSRLAVNGSIGLTNVEMTRLFTRLLGVGAGGAGVSVFTLAALGVVAWPVGLAVIPCAFVAGGAIWYSLQLDEYENPDELEKFRREAAGMNLDSVIHAYGWNDILRFEILPPELFAQKYRQQIQGMKLVQVIDHYEKSMRHFSQYSSHKYMHQLPLPRESAKLWRQETATMSFDQIIYTYPLDKLEKYRIVEHGEMNCIKNLKREYEAIKAQRDVQAAQIEREFQHETQQHKSAYDAECANADRVYNGNYAVRELQGFELRYTRERQGVQEQLNRSKVEARACFDRAVAAFTNNGSIQYSSLSIEDRARYDQKNRELQLAENQADRTAQVAIEQINARRNERLIHLNTEETRVRGERTRAIEGAKRRYDAGVDDHRLRKEQRLSPIDASLRSSANDFDGRYRAYLRTIGAAH